MYSKGIIRTRPSISPARSRHVEFKQNQSVNTHYDQRLKQSASTKQNNQSSDNLHVSKLESRVLQLQKRIDQQKYQMQTLNAQTEHYTRLCQEQKRQLGSQNVQMLRQQYQEQIRELAAEKDKLEEFICEISEEYSRIEEEEELQLVGMKQENLQIKNMIEEALSVKETLLKKIAEADQQHMADQVTIAEQEERLDELRNVQRKLKIALLELNSIEKS